MSLGGRTINLRGESDDEGPEFKIGHMEDEGSYARPASEDDVRSTDKVKVKFDKFVNLIVTHAYEDLFEKYHDEDIVMSTNLLADLANSYEEKDDGKKIPLIFVFGILLGIAVTWILLRTTV